jgi:uncharacterized protein involved in outer membrane biogenesis
MRLAVQVAAALLILLILGFVLLAVLLPRIAGSEAIRARLETVASHATGQEVRWDELTFGLLPPRLVVLKPTIAPPGTPGEPSLEADSVSLRVALLPLLARTVAIDSLVVEGVTVRLRRTAEGLELPLDRPGPAKPGKPKAVPDAPAEEGGALALAVGDVRLIDSRLLIEDRTVAPQLTWDVVDLEARAQGSALTGPIDVELSGKLATGGAVQVEGTAWLDGRVDLTATLDGLVVGPLQRYLEPGQKLSGELAGSVKASGPAADPQAVTANLTLSDGLVDAAGLALRGRVRVSATLEGGIAKASGRFEVDATDADVTYGEAFQKPRGKAATVTGRLVPGKEGGFALEELQLRVHNLDAKGRVETGRRARVELEAPVRRGAWPSRSSRLQRPRSTCAVA